MAGIFDPNLTYVAVPDLNYGIVKISNLRPSAGSPSAPSGALARSAISAYDYINNFSNLFFHMVPGPVVKEYRIRFGIRILEPQKAPGDRENLL